MERAIDILIAKAIEIIKKRRREEDLKTLEKSGRMNEDEPII